MRGINPAGVWPMSTTGKHAVAVSRTAGATENIDVVMEKKESSKNYRGFVAGVFSGVAKLSGEYLVLSLFTFLRSPPRSLNCYITSSFSSQTYQLILLSSEQYTNTTPQSATPSTPSKCASKPQTEPASPAPSNASSSPSATKESGASTKAPLPPS